MRKEPKPYRVTIIRYTAPDGRRCKSTDPGAVRTKEKSKAYYADHPTTGKRTPLDAEDLGDAWVELRKLQKEALQAARGITDPYTDHAARPIAEHLEAWVAYLRLCKTADSRIELMHGRLKKLFAVAAWVRLADVSEPSAREALARLGGDPSANATLNSAGERRGRSAQTRNHYLSHLRQWLRWCVGDRRLRDNPLLLIKPVAVDSDRRHDRRAPTEQEIGKLFGYLAGPEAVTRCGMTGPCRALGYQVSLATGLRASELRSLTRDSFDLDAGELQLRAAYSKRRRVDVQHLPSWLVDELKDWFAGGGKLWDGFPERCPGRLLKADLKAAEVDYEVAGPDGPLYFDFHALRHFFVTTIAHQPGLSLKTLLSLTRHSNPRLALKVYAHARRDETKKAIDRLNKIAPVQKTEEPETPEQA